MPFFNPYDNLVFIQDLYALISIFIIICYKGLFKYYITMLGGSTRKSSLIRGDHRGSHMYGGPTCLTKMDQNHSDGHLWGPKYS